MLRYQRSENSLDLPPPQLEAVINELPPAQALSAKVTWATMTTAYRSDPLFDAFITGGMATTEETDDLFRTGVAL